MRGQCVCVCMCARACVREKVVDGSGWGIYVFFLGGG